MSKSKNVTVIDDKTVKAVEKIVGSLKQRNEELEGLASKLKTDANATTSFMNSVAKKVGEINTSLNGTAEAMTGLEQSISKISAAMARDFDKMAKAAQGALTASREANKISKGSSWNDTWRDKQRTANQKIGTAQVKDGKATNDNFLAMQTREAEWNKIVQVTGEHLNQLTQIALMKERLNLATREQAMELENVSAKYKQIADMNRAVAQNENFDGDSYLTSETAKQQLQGKKLGVQNNSVLAELQAQNALMREYIAAQRQKILNDKETYRETRKETLLQQKRKKELDKEIKMELERERIKERIAELEEKQNKSRGEKRELKELNSQLSQLSSGTSTMSAGASYFNTTGQMIQVIRELPNFAISAQTGLMSLSNNLPTLFEGFRLAASGGRGLSGVFEMLVNKATALNLGFVAFTVILMNLPAIIKAINDDFIDMHQVLEDIGEGLSSGSSELAKQIDSWETLKQTLVEAKYGLADGTQALSDYNDQFATTLGYAQDLGEAYKIMEQNSDRFYSSVLNHEIAMTIQRAALDQWRKEMEKEATNGMNFISTWFGADSNTANIYNRIADITGVIENWKGYENRTNPFAGLSSIGGVGQDKLIDYMKESGNILTGTKGSKFFEGFNEKVNKILGEKLKGTKIQVEFGQTKGALGFEGDLFVGINGKKANSLTQDERTAVAAAINEAFRPLTDREFQKNMKGAMEDLKRKFGLADIFQQQTIPTSSKSGGASRARQAPTLSVIKPRDGFTKDEFYNERLERLKKEVERHERDFSKQYASSEKDQYESRLKAYEDYIKKKQEIAEIEMAKNIFNAHEQREKEKHDIQEQREQYQKQLAELRKRAEKWNEYVKSTGFKIGKDKAEQNVKTKQQEHDNLAESLKAQGLVEGSKEYEKRMTMVVNHLQEAKETLATYTKTGLGDVIKQSEKNIAAWEKKAQDREKQIDQNYIIEIKKAVESGATDMVKVREEALQKALEVQKTALKGEIDLVKRRYEEEIRIINRFYSRLERMRQQNGALDYRNGTAGEKAGAISAKAGEIFAKGVAGYSRDNNMSRVISIRDSKRKNEDRAQAADEAREEILDRVSDYEDRVRSFSKNNALDKDRRESLSASFQKDLEDSGKYDATEIDSMVVKFNDAMNGINTEEGQRAFDELKKSATSSFDDTLDECKETRKALKEEFDDQWVSAVEEMAVQVMQNIMSLLDELLAAEIAYQRRALNNWVETQNKLVEDQYKSQVIDEKEYQAQKAAIEEEQRKRKHEIDMREEKANRVKATANVLIGTAQAITYAALAAFQGGGVAAPALFAVYAALLTASAAAQIAAIHAAPFPEYAEGTDFHKGGLAIVGDAGKSELIETKSGKLYKTPDVPTLMDIERGAKVHPDFSVAMRNLNDDRQIVVLSENKKQLTLLRQTNRSLGAIVSNTRTQQRNYNRVWN